MPSSFGYKFQEGGTPRADAASKKADSIKQDYDKKVAEQKANEAKKAHEASAKKAGAKQMPSTTGRQIFDGGWSPGKWGPGNTMSGGFNIGFNHPILSAIKKKK